LDQAAGRRGFETRRTVVELHGLCTGCKGA
jgi:Fe2+ or Zn2+ uptake regulation protein